MELILHELRRGGFAPVATVADSEAGFLEALSIEPDIILADYSLPQFDALRALAIVKEQRLDFPLIVVTGHLDDEAAIVCLEQGACDFLQKDRLARLPQAVQSALDERRMRDELREADAAIEVSRRRLRAIFENTAEGILLSDDSGHFFEANPAALELLGFSKSELSRLSPWEISAEPADDAEARWREFIRTTERRAGDHQIRRKDGSSRLVEHQYMANIDPGVHMTVLRDVTDKRKTEAALLHAQKLESLGVLAGGVAHDFNNLLVAVLGNADLALLDLAPGASAIESVRQIKVAARRAADLARQMLALSGRGVFVVERLELNAIVEEMTHLLRASITRGAVLRYNLIGALPPVNGDATQIRQIIMNLVVNASDAIGSRSGTITITTGALRADRAYLNEMLLAPDLPEGDYVYFEVTDTGAGMSPQTLQNIFDPFFTTKFTGRGLGLAAVLGIIRGHGGAIKVYSELGKGTTFKILLPCSDATDDAEHEAPSVERDWTGSGTVLVVDDDESVRTLATRAVERLGFNVVQAEDGLSAVQVFAQRPNDFVFVLLDLTMPHLGGEDTFRELRRISPAIPVVVMSGYNQSETMDRFAGKSLAGYVQKPFEFVTLRSVVRQVIEGQSPKA